MTAAFPQTGFAHTVVVWSSDDGPLDEAAVRTGVRELVSDATATGRFADLSDARVRFAPDGHTAAVDIAMTGDFNGDGAKASLGVLRDALVPALRADLPGTEVAVTGDTAGSEDFTASLRSHLPLVFGFVLAVTFLVLVLAFRSVVIAGTAVALNLLSVGAAYGLLTLVFQHGLAADLLGVHESGFIVDWLPLFLFVILFGLSMDYHVFVVSRVREAHRAGMPTRADGGSAGSSGISRSSASMCSVGSRRSSQPGSHQLRRPRAAMAAGSRTARTRVASSRTAAASPMPSCSNSSSDSVAKMLNTPTITAAALVTTPADDVTPAATAARVGIPARCASRTRLTTNTW
jgi:uncharacterized membrane protein YdfJ with MMPL/SSD domain